MYQISSITLLLLLGLGPAIGFQVPLQSSLFRTHHRFSSSQLKLKLNQQPNENTDLLSLDITTATTTTKTTTSRRSALSRFMNGMSSSAAALATIALNDQVLTRGTGAGSVGNGQHLVANAAPPIAIIAEELGYFPVTNRAGETKYVPAKVRRKSSEQSIAFAQHLKNIGAVMYGAYWCPHCAHQKELFGAEAWSLIPYVECSLKGFYYDNSKVENIFSKIDGYPTWYIPNQGGGSTLGNKLKRKNYSDWVSGEMPLERLVALSDYKGAFDVVLEGPEVGISAGSCR